MKTIKLFCLVTLALIIFSQPFFTQTIDTLKSKEKIVAIKLTDIPIEIEKSTSLIAVEENKLKNSKIVDEVQALYEKLSSKFKDNKSKFEKLDLTQQTSGKIKELVRQWQVLQNDVSQLVGDITDQTTELESQKTKFDKLNNIWNVTIINSSEVKIPANLVKAIKKIQDNIFNVDRLITNQLNALLIIQTDLSQYSIEIENTLTLLKDIDNANRRNILTRNANPIWKIGSDTTETKSIESELSDIISSYKTSYSEFLLTYEESIPIYALFFIAFFFFVIYLKRNSRKIESEIEDLTRSLILLNYPLSATLLIFGIVMTFFYGEAPAAFKSIVKIILLIPLIRIMSRIVNPVMIKPLLIFSLLFIINQIKIAASSATSLERMLLFFLTIISIIGLIWVIEINKLFKQLYKNEHKKYLDKARKIALTLFLIALVANIFGFVKLGIVIINGVYDTFFATAILITGKIILHSILLVFFKTKFALKFRVVKFKAEIIKNTFEKIIGIGVKIIWLIIVLNAFNIYVPVKEWLMDQLNADIGFGNFSTSLMDILLFVVTVWISYLISKFLRFILEEDILPRLSLPRGVPGAISTLTKYFIISLGFIIAVSSIGFELSQFAILVGALGVGIGFGLQDLVNNFISGLILIFERPIQVGDVVHFNQIEGRVTNIGIRSSTIKTWQGSEIIVPNGHLVSNDVTNWTFSDKMRRIEIAVGVEYGSDVAKVKELLLKCAQNDDRIVKDPEPAVIFRDFGESSLNFELRCWTSIFDLWFTISSELRFAINASFKENGITIPFPQRDVYIKTPNSSKVIKEKTQKDEKEKEK